MHWIMTAMLMCTLVLLAPIGIAYYCIASGWTHTGTAILAFEAGMLLARHLMLSGDRAAKAPKE